MAGLVPAIPIVERRAILIEIAGTSPAMTPGALLLRNACQLLTAVDNPNVGEAP